jgi:hypothetical protein
MGICDSCFKSTEKEKYDEIPKGESSSLIGKGGASYQQGAELSNFHAAAGEKQDEKLAAEFDLNCSVFEGLELQQKFTNKSTYDTRFVWINLNSRTIHMSQYMTKDRRHKEATLQDVTAVVAGAPVKSKRGAGGAEPKDSCCLAINFKRGGGIDLAFNTEAERNLWFSTLKKIIVQNGNLTSLED